MSFFDRPRRALSNLISDKNQTPTSNDIDAFFTEDKYKRHFSMLGPVLGGKTTICAGLFLTARMMTAHIDNFYCYVHPKSSSLVSDANNLLIGRFPPKTDPYNPVPPEAGIFLSRRAKADKKVQLGLCDVAGEVFTHMGIDPRVAYAQKLRLADQRVLNYVRDSQGYNIVLPANQALIFRNNPAGRDPDEHVFRILSQTLEYKRKRKQTIEGIGVWLSQWDKAMEQAEYFGINIFDKNDPQGALSQFMWNGFPSVAMLLKGYEKAGIVKYFRSYFAIKKQADGVTEECWDNDPKQKVIDIVDNPDFPTLSKIRYKPNYAEHDYVEHIKWMGRFAD